MRLPGISGYRRLGFDDVPGWMWPGDLDLFDLFLDEQMRFLDRADILEVGCYQGKSAIALGFGLRDDETLVVCDLFDGDPRGTPIEGMDVYEGLKVSDFENWYGKFHTKPAEIHVCPSSKRSPNIKDREFRFVHVDGGHAYRAVVADLYDLTTQVSSWGVVAVDDFRSAHTPGVSAAVWQACFQEILYPFCLSENKLYATTTPTAYEYWLSVCRESDLPHEEHEIYRGSPVFRTWKP